MTDYFGVRLGDDELKKISVLGLAHVGDGVYELLVRTRLCTHGGQTSQGMHKKAVALVCASAQAAAFKKISSMLTEEESAVFRRGRNAKVNSVPKNAVMADYHAATGLEALFGWLWLRGSTERINTLFNTIMED